MDSRLYLVITRNADGRIGYSAREGSRKNYDFYLEDAKNRGKTIIYKGFDITSEPLKDAERILKEIQGERFLDVSGKIFGLGKMLEKRKQEGGQE